MRLTPLERWIGVVAAGLCSLYVWFTLQPDLIFSATTTNGGDTGAHVWWPAFLRDHILPRWRLAGWTPDWYAGFPAGHFYFPLPALAVVVLDLILPYNIAFKLVTVAGPVALPVAAWVFARGIGARWPAPPLFAVATLPFLFYTGYTIYGGNLASNLAGEFSFTIAICFALAFLGTLYRALEQRSGLALPAALLAATALSHIIVTVFAAAAAVVVWLVHRPRDNLPVALAVGGVGALLTAVWTLPLVARLGYTTDMGWAKEPAMGPSSNLLPPDLRWAFLLAVVGVVAGLALGRRSTLFLVALAVIFGAAFVLAPEGRLWNARLLPFYYLSVLFLAASGVAELASALGRLGSILVVAFCRLTAWLSRRRATTAGGELSPLRPGEPATAGGELSPLRPGEPAEPVAAARGHDPAAGGEGPPGADGRGEPAPQARTTPPSRDAAAVARKAAVPLVAVPAVIVAAALVAGTWYTFHTREFLPDWIRWNYTGYEAKPAYPEFREVIETMGRLPPGRALWEPSPEINQYGTTLALELLPHFTDGRIGSMEGLYFESSATTPYHFMMVAPLAEKPSNPVRGLPYRNMADFDVGVRQMQLFGVRWYMAQSDPAKAAADDHPDLRLVAETGQPDVEPHVARWRIYEVLGAPLVEALRYEPVVLEGVTPGRWQEPAVEWFDDPEALDRPLAAGGPGSWDRASPGEARGVAKRRLPEVEVTGIDSGVDWIRFRVSRPGVPVLVKTSHFPNWQATGADGPWRVTPNLMVVVPTAGEVTLRYGRTPVDLAGMGLSALGLAGVVLLSRWRPGPLPARRPDEDGAGGEEMEGRAQPEDQNAPAFI